MLYGRWRSRHRVSNIRKQGEAQIKRNKRRAMKNSRMQDKKKRRTNAANYLIQNKDKYICRYPEKDLVQILKDSGYHSEEWEETDEDDEDDENDEEEVVTKKNSIYIYERWWRSPALQRLLHDRIDPTVELLRKKPPNLKCKRVLDKTETASVPPAGAPSWCLNREALEKFNRLTKNIPVYDYDTDESIIQDNNGADDDVDNNVAVLQLFNKGFQFVSVLKLRNGPNGTLQIMFPSAFDFGLECQVTLISDCYYGFCDLTFQNSKIMVLWSFKFINSLNLELTLRLFGCKV
ncbi:hypothetical protein RhiirA1_472832 [Rhizophagus irregularis]|uniref:Uncharacterized protein n=1 Tax=Rhizophagus irregularis TaxID=588596 RepID=A0A2N0R1S2_9GLOM|nr:hypothetical protein RhiirA1_472832 [Rhizophagus irregularis]